MMDELVDQALPFRPSRTCYPGSKFVAKSRYDLPTRHKAYGEGDEAEAILFSGTSLQPKAWAGEGGVRGGSGALSDAARSILHPLADRNVPELPIIAQDDVHGCVVLGGRSSGKTSLIFSLITSISGKYPGGKGSQEQVKRRSMPAYGQPYELPDREVVLPGGATKAMKLILTDTPPCGTNHKEESPLCAAVTPNSTQHVNAIPSWMRITMRSSSPHYAALYVIDATATPLWEDQRLCRDLARLLAVLKRSHHTVVIAVTKMLKARQNALRDQSYGIPHGGEVGKDPRSSYESFAGRYLEKVCASIQAKAYENSWSMSQGPDCPPFPLVNATIFDVPTWVSAGDFGCWQGSKGTSELPNLKYHMQQLERLTMALSCRSHPE